MPDRYSVTRSLDVRASKALSFHLQRATRTAEAYELRRSLAACGLNRALRVGTHMTEPELATLWHLARVHVPSGGCAVEIGSYLGASTCYLACGLAPHGATLICIDTWENETMDEGQRDTFAEFQANTRAVASTLTPLRKRSDEVTRSELPAELHLAFIDGDHSYGAASGDFALMGEQLVSGGVVAFHDAVHFSGVARTIGEALSSGRWQLGGHVDNLLWLRRTPPAR